MELAGKHYVCVFGAGGNICRHRYAPQGSKRQLADDDTEVPAMKQLPPACVWQSLRPVV
jgi:hypothetical protein